MKHEQYLEMLDKAIKSQGKENQYYNLVVMSEDESDENGYKMTVKQYHIANPAHDSYSVAKSITALGLGLLYDRGLVNLTTPVLEYLKYHVNPDIPGWEKVTLADVMHHQTGAEYGIDLDFVNANMWEDRDWLKGLVSIPMTKRRGVDFEYSDGNYYIVSRVIEEITGYDAEKLIEKYIFLPLEFHQNAWSRDNDGHTVGGTGLYMRTEDMCKLAWLQLNDGIWKGEKIVSDAWIKMMQKPSFEGYGFGVGTVGKNGFGAGGWAGQGYYYNRKDKVAVAWHSFDTPGLMEACAEIGG